MNHTLTYPDQVRSDDKLVGFCIDLILDLIIVFLLEYGIELFVELLLYFLGA